MAGDETSDPLELLLRENSRLAWELDSCEDQYRELEAESASRLTKKDNVINSLQADLELKWLMLDQLKEQHVKELATRDEKIRTLIKASELAGSFVRAMIQELVGEYSYNLCLLLLRLESWYLTSCSYVDFVNCHRSRFPSILGQH